MIGQPFATAVCAIAAQGKASAAQFQAIVAQVKPSGTAGDSSATAGKPSGTALLALAPAVKAPAAATDASPTVSNALPTVSNALPTVSNALPTVSNALPTVSNALPTVSNARPAVPNASSATATGCSRIPIEKPAATAAFTFVVHTHSATSQPFSLTLTLSRWEREQPRTVFVAPPRSCLPLPLPLAAQRGQTPSFSQREKAGMREKIHGLPPHPPFPRP
jgi:hypothetical protein